MTNSQFLFSQFLDHQVSDICHCLPPERTWHKVNDLKVGLKWRLGEGEVRYELRLEPCWTMLIISSFSAMWARWASLDMDSTWVQARMSDYSLNWTKGLSATQCCMMLSVQLAHPKVTQPNLGPFWFQVCYWSLILHPAWMPDGPAKKPDPVPGKYWWSNIHISVIWFILAFLNLYKWNKKNSGWRQSSLDENLHFEDKLKILIQSKTFCCQSLITTHFFLEVIFILCLNMTEIWNNLI